METDRRNSWKQLLALFLPLLIPSLWAYIYYFGERLYNFVYFKTIGRFTSTIHFKNKDKLYPIVIKYLRDHGHIDTQMNFLEASFKKKEIRDIFVDMICGAGHKKQEVEYMPVRGSSSFTYAGKKMWFSQQELK